MPELSLLPMPSWMKLCAKLTLPDMVNLSPRVWSRFTRPEVRRAPLFCCVPGDCRSLTDAKYFVLLKPPDDESRVSNDGLWLSYSWLCQSYHWQVGVQFAFAMESACDEPPRYG